MEYIHVKALTKVFNRLRLKDNKARIWIGGLKPKWEGSKGFGCFLCDSPVYMSDDDEFIDKKHHIKVCALCALENFNLDDDAKLRLIRCLDEDIG